MQGCRTFRFSCTSTTWLVCLTLQDRVNNYYCYYLYQSIIISLFPLAGLPSTSFHIYPLSYLRPELAIRPGRVSASTAPAARTQLHSCRQVPFRARMIRPTSISLPTSSEPCRAGANAVSSSRQLCLSWKGCKYLTSPQGDKKTSAAAVKT